MNPIPVRLSEKSAVVVLAVVSQNGVNRNRAINLLVQAGALVLADQASYSEWYKVRSAIRGQMFMDRDDQNGAQ